MRKILVVVGTYSEAILMAPLVQRLREAPALQTFVHVIPAQRRTINQVLSFFGIRLDEGLRRMIARDPRFQSGRAE